MIEIPTEDATEIVALLGKLEQKVGAAQDRFVTKHGRESATLAEDLEAIGYHRVVIRRAIANEAAGWKEED